MSQKEHTASAEHGHDTIGPAARKRLWRVFWLLLFITIFEVGIAFSSIPHDILVKVFILLTIVKAYYIIFYFMHMKHERTNMAWTVLGPFVLIAYFIYMMMTEGNALNWARTVFDQII